MLSKKHYVVLFGHPKNGKSPNNSDLEDALKSYFESKNITPETYTPHMKQLLTWSQFLAWPGGFAGFYNQAKTPKEQQEAIEHAGLSSIRELWFSSLATILTAEPHQRDQAFALQILNTIEAARRTTLLDNIGSPDYRVETCNNI